MRREKYKCINRIELDGFKFKCDLEVFKVSYVTFLTGARMRCTGGYRVLKTTPA